MRLRSAISFLPDVRAYRENQLKPTGLEPLFPLWQIPTDALAREMIAGGLRARLSCVDTKQLPAAFAGREFDAALLRDLPPEADPCGERGEFHTCVYAGPMFYGSTRTRNGRDCGSRRLCLRGLSIERQYVARPPLTS